MKGNTTKVHPHSGDSAKSIHTGALEHHIFRSSGRNRAIGMLCIGYVLKSLRNKARQIIIVQ